MKQLGLAALLSLCILLVTRLHGQAINRAPALDECDSKMTESACDSKIRHDLAIAIRNNPKECLFEPDWRPTSLKESALHVSKVDSATVQTVIEGKQYSLNLEGYHDDTCRNSERSQCPHWR